MAAPLLQLLKADFEGGVGDYLGFGFGAAKGDLAWTEDQNRKVKFCVASGLRNFYYPALPGGGSYEWSFLKPTAEWGLPAGASEVPLPSDFGYLSGDLYDVTTGTHGSPVPPHAKVRALLAQAPSRTGPPECFDVEPAGPAGKRQLLVVYPAADQARTLRGRYSLHADALSDGWPYAHGGQAHSETILESCLAVAEERYQNVSGGVHFQSFQRKLAASLAYDRRLKPQSLGRNADGTAGRYWPGRRRPGNWGYTVTFDGAEPD